MVNINLPYTCISDTHFLAGEEVGSWSRKITSITTETLQWYLANYGHGLDKLGFTKGHTRQSCEQIMYLYWKRLDSPSLRAVPTAKYRGSSFRYRAYKPQRTTK